MGDDGWGSSHCQISGIVLVVSTELVLNPKKGCKPEALVCAAGHSPKCLVDLVGPLSKGDHFS